MANLHIEMFAWHVLWGSTSSWFSIWPGRVNCLETLTSRRRESKKDRSIFATWKPLNCLFVSFFKQDQPRIQQQIAEMWFLLVNSANFVALYLYLPFIAEAPASQCALWLATPWVQRRLNELSVSNLIKFLDLPVKGKLIGWSLLRIMCPVTSHTICC